MMCEKFHRERMGSESQRACKKEEKKRNETLSLLSGVLFSNIHSSILAVSKDLRLRRAHVGFPDLLEGQGNQATVTTTERTVGATGKSNVGDVEGVD